MADIFISYSQPHRQAAEVLVGALGDSGFDVWWDYDLAGGVQFRDEILAVLRISTVAIVIWSASSVKSRWVRDEADEAARSDKLVPLLMPPPCTMADVPLGFRSFQTIPLGDYSRIVNALRRHGLTPTAVSSGTSSAYLLSVDEAAKFVKVRDVEYQKRCESHLSIAKSNGYILIKIAADPNYDCAEDLVRIGALRHVEDRMERSSTSRHRSYTRYEITQLGRLLAGKLI